MAPPSSGPRTRLLMVVTTVGSRADAQRLARTLVEGGLVACAQITAIDSIYRWQGALQDATEFRLDLKIAAAAYDELEAALRALHPYELPAIHAVDVERADAAYAAWVEANSGPGAGP